MTVEEAINKVVKMQEQSQLNNEIFLGARKLDKLNKPFNINNFAYGMSNSQFKNFKPQNSMFRDINLMSSYNNAILSSIGNIGISPIFQQLGQIGITKDITNMINEIKIHNITSGLNNLFDGMKPIIEAQNKMIQSLTESLKPITNIFANLDFSNTSRLSGRDTSLLDNFYWVIPFEMDYEKISNLSKYKTQDEFNEFVVKYFTNKRTNKLFERCSRNFKSDDKKLLLKQVEQNYFNGNYAICITSLVTMLDGITLELIEPGSSNQHSSYKAINGMLEYINEQPVNMFGYQLYLKVDIINNFYTKLYESTTDFKQVDTSKLIRHINSHGVWYSNEKVEVLRLMNAIFFCQQIIKETKLQESFTARKIKVGNKEKLVFQKI